MYLRARDMQFRSMNNSNQLQTNLSHLKVCEFPKVKNVELMEMDCMEIKDS